MELLRYLVFFLLPFSFGFPNINSEEDSEKYVEPQEFSDLSVAQLVEEAEDKYFCPPKEIFSPCLAHCQKNCSNWSDPTVPCLKICVPGCICDYGLVRGPYGDCIQPRKCPARGTLQSVSGTIAMECPVDEHFEECKAHCQKNCSNWDQESECSQMCVSGCVCDEGFVRAPYGKCVLTEKCSSLNQKPKTNIKKMKQDKNLKSCPEGEERSILQSIQDSNVFCASKNGEVKFCPPTYLNGCVCKKGHIRHENQCIDHRLLPHANEIHFMQDFSRNAEYSLADLQPEIVKESLGLMELTKDFKFDSTPQPITQPLEFNSQSKNNDEISTTMLQDTLAQNLKPDFPGCESQFKCLEFCWSQGFQIGYCKTFGSDKYCFCRYA